MVKYKVLVLGLLVMLLSSTSNAESIEDNFWGNDGFSKDNIKEILSVKEKKQLDEKITPPIIKPNSIIEMLDQDQSSINKYKKLNNLELIEKVDSLKESVFELKSKLFLLSEATFKTKIISSAVKIIQDNKLSNIFRAESISYILDGEEIIKETFLDKNMPDVLNIYDRVLSPGTHELKILINLTGRGEGIYSYLNDYVFRLKTKKSFSIIEGKQTELKIELKEKNRFLKSINNRPEINYKITFKDIDNSNISKKVVLSDKEK